MFRRAELRVGGPEELPDQGLIDEIPREPRGPPMVSHARVPCTPPPKHRGRCVGASGGVGCAEMQHPRLQEGVFACRRRLSASALEGAWQRCGRRASSYDRCVRSGSLGTPGRTTAAALPVVAGVDAADPTHTVWVACHHIRSGGQPDDQMGDVARPTGRADAARDVVRLTFQVVRGKHH